MVSELSNALLLCARLLLVKLHLLFSLCQLSRSLARCSKPFLRVNRMSRQLGLLSIITSICLSLCGSVTKPMEAAF